MRAIRNLAAPLLIALTLLGAACAAAPEMLGVGHIHLASPPPGAACAAAPEMLEPTGSDFVITVVNRSEVEPATLHMLYATDGETWGGGIMSNADGSPIEKGAPMSWQFLPQDFPEGADLTTFSIAYTAVLEDGTELPCGEAVSIAAAYGESYILELTGSAANGLSLLPEAAAD